MSGKIFPQRETVAGSNVSAAKNTDFAQSCAKNYKEGKDPKKQLGTDARSTLHDARLVRP